MELEFATIQAILDPGDFFWKNYEVILAESSRSWSLSLFYLWVSSLLCFSFFVSNQNILINIWELSRLLNMYVFYNEPLLNLDKVDYF